MDGHRMCNIKRGYTISEIKTLHVFSLVDTSFKSIHGYMCTDVLQVQYTRYKGKEKINTK